MTTIAAKCAADARTRRSRLGLFFVSTVAVLTAATAHAGEGSLTLTDAMRRGRALAPEVQAALARQDAAAARRRETRAHRLPRVELSEVWTRTDSPAEAFGLLLNQERFSFPEFAASDPNDPGWIESATTRLELSLPLYTGGELTGRVDQAARGAAAAAESAHRAGDEAAFAAGAAWVQLAQARERVTLLERSLATVTAHADLARVYVERGTRVSSEQLLADVERSRVADLLAEAKGRVRIAEASLSFRLAADPARRWDLADLPGPAAPAEGLGVWLAAAAERPDLVAARELAEAAALEVRIRRAATRPRIGLTARYDLTDRDLFGTEGEAASILVAASFDLIAGGRHRASVAAAEAEAVAATTEAERFAEAVRLEVRSAWEELAAARDRHATTRAALAAAAEAERIVSLRFRQGLLKTIDLLDATTARREAETRELVARAEAHLALLRLARAAGRAPESVVAAGINDLRRPAGTARRLPRGRPAASGGEAP